MTSILTFVTLLFAASFLPAQLTVSPVDPAPLCTSASAVQLVPGVWTTELRVHCAHDTQVCAVVLSHGLDPAPALQPCGWFLLDLQQTILVDLMSPEPPFGWHRVWSLDVPDALGPLTWFAQPVCISTIGLAPFCVPEAWKFELQ